MIAPRRPLIEVRRLHRYFGPTKAVYDMSFEVYAGEVFGYIGPNGAGKTTSMRILATLDEPTYGDAFVDGFSVVDDPDRVRRRLGFMPDYFGTYQNVNVVEYLDFFARAYGLRSYQRKAAIDFAMEFTLLDQLADKPILGLSKGMKQRLCLGRTMIHDPAVLILDEPAAGLDPRARIELREMIGRLAELGKTVLVSSHILTELAEMCHRVGIIEQGRLLAVGSVDEISASSREARSEVRLRTLNDMARLLAWLRDRIDIDDVADRAGQVIFTHAGGQPEQAELLRELVTAGFSIIEFGSKTKSLEDVFLHVTEGRVQ
jgi:ABC-2 type transport system ATP-binding protein